MDKKVKEKKKDNKKENKDSHLGKSLCRRCGKDKVKLYSWKGFHFCFDCVKELGKK